MSRQATIVQVFVASPSDVQIERDLLESLIAELNRTWSSTLGVMFELLKWETHVHPSFGSDPQSVINQQIGDHYDVFIGILWGRFGTPTPRSLSGTMEEFERALTRLKNAKDRPEIMIYFKDAPLPPSKIDPSQLKLVLDFRASISTRGGCYSVFETEADFQSSLRAHLASLAQKFASEGKKHEVQHEPSITQTETLILDEDDLGYLDYTEIYESRMSEFTATLGAISDATERVGHQMTQRTEEFLKSNSSPTDSKSAKRLIKRAADDMEAYAEILEQQLPLMSSSRESALQALSRALSLYDDFSSKDQSGLEFLYSILTGVSSAAKTSHGSLGTFRSTVHSLPRMTSELNKSKRVVVTQLDLILDEIGKTAHTIDNILESIDRMIQRDRV